MPCCSCALARMTLPSCPAVTPLVEHYQRAFSASISRCNRLKADFQPRTRCFGKTLERSG
jgi:hypothetical protein